MSPAPHTRNNSIWASTALTTIISAATVTTTGCSSAPSRPELTDAQFAEQAVIDKAAFQEHLEETNLRLVDLMWRKIESGEPNPTVDFLAMSGGGDFGAFGSGFLVGWGSVSTPEYQRPNFEIVTGVSTGALLAPFAYVGTDESYHKVDSFYRNPDAAWVKSRGLLFFLPSNPSFMVISKLEEALGVAVDRQLIEQMAEKSRTGALMWVGATNIDLGRQQLWSIGREAETAIESGDLELVQRKLLASASIPAVFPPVTIDDSMYVDGGVTANILLKLDPHNPNGFIQIWQRLHPDTPLPRARFWIIINNQLTQKPATVQGKWPSILGPSLNSAIRSATMSEVRWLAAQADYVNTLLGTEIEVRVVAIPDDWRAPVAGDFKKENMESLSDLGRELGADPTSWQEWSIPNSN